MTTSRHTMYRPPAEAESVLLRVADGCPHNGCAFCAMYRGVPYRERDTASLSLAIAEAASCQPSARRVFMADGDALALPSKTLYFILDSLHAAFPALARVNCYASGQALAAKTDSELATLRNKGLHTLYLGLESGSDKILHAMGKGGSVQEAVDGCVRAQQAGLCLSVMALIGLGGQELSDLHVAETARALNLMQPRLISCLRLFPVPDTPLQRRILAGRFRQLTEVEAVRELRALIAALELQHTVFRADHSSNILPLSGRLPRDKTRLIGELDELVDCCILDTTGPGPFPAVL